MSAPRQGGAARAWRWDVRADALVAAALAILVFVVWGPLVTVGFNLADEGWQLTAIDRIASGQRLYVDFVRSYGPGLYGLLYAMSGGGAADVLAIRWAWMGGLALLVAGTYAMARPWCAPWAAGGAALLAAFLRPPAHKTFVPLAYLGALWLCRWIDEPGRPARAWLAAGVGFGALSLVRQEAGVFGAAIAWASLVWPGRVAGAPLVSRTLGPGVALGAGFALAWLPVTVWLAAGGALGVALEQIVLAGARGNAAMALPFPGVADVFAGPDRLERSLFYLPLLAAAAGAAACVPLLRRDPRDRGARCAAQWTVMALAGHAIFFSRTDFQHLLQALVAPSLLVAWLCTLALRRGTRRAAAAAAALCALAWIAAAAVLRSDLPRERALAADGAVLEVRGARLRVPRELAAVLGELTEAIQRRTRPGEPILVLPYAPGLYLVADRPNPTRHDAFVPGLASDENQRELVAELERRAVPVLVIFQPALDLRPERRLQVFAPVLAKYIRGAYRRAEKLGPFGIWERREAHSR